MIYSDVKEKGRTEYCAAVSRALVCVSMWANPITEAPCHEKVLRETNAITGRERERQTEFNLNWDHLCELESENIQIKTKLINDSQSQSDRFREHVSKCQH